MNWKSILGISLIGLVLCAPVMFSAAAGMRTRVRTIRSVQQLSAVTGLVFPEGTTVIDGVDRVSPFVGPTGTWAVVLIPSRDLPSFMTQPGLELIEGASSDDINWPGAFRDYEIPARHRDALRRLQQPKVAAAGDSNSGRWISVAYGATGAIVTRVFVSRWTL